MGFICIDVLPLQFFRCHRLAPNVGLVGWPRGGSTGVRLMLTMPAPRGCSQATDHRPSRGRGAHALSRLRSRSCIIDGEAVACNDNGIASFDRIRYRRHDGVAFLYAFDLIELNGDDLRRDPLEVRKATLASIVAKARPGIRFNEHIDGDGPTIVAHACKMGLEGIVSKRRDRSGRSPPQAA